MLTPGRNYPGTAIRLTVNFQNDAETDIDPATVTLKVLSPQRTITSFTHGVGADMVRLDTGDYLVDFVPDRAGKWHFRWETTGVGQTVAVEGLFYVQASPFTDPGSECPAYGRLV